ncbi:hypothetical protein [Jeongeupia chitinilytica]|uniref:hypothetical protein n=1 Tax=Jeongeupia chitinilytica TaxID=1041641 RepID=UPI00167B650E|nr:hypothetical protein [Jeongeupia chitinilytica]
MEKEITSPGLPPVGWHQKKLKRGYDQGGTGKPQYVVKTRGLHFIGAPQNDVALQKFCA